MDPDLERARAAFERSEWRDAVTQLSALASGGGLDAADLERLGVAAYLIGDDDACAAAMDDAHSRALEQGDPELAARCAFWLAFSLMMRGQMAQASGWLSRAERDIAQAGQECAAAGYLLVPRVLGALEGGQPDEARHLAAEAARLGARFADADLVAFGRLGEGQALIAMGDVDAGLSRLDEAMVSVSTGELGPIATGIVYCAVIIECMKLFDVRRAGEWTAALSAWCDGQPDLVPYRGQCLVHRSQLAQAAGDWNTAVETAAAACAHLADPPHPALGMAFYQEADLSRLRGAFDQARSEYREASRNGHDPLPGLALLELAEGDTATAAASIRRALQERTDPLLRPPLLAAAVEIFIAAGDLDDAGAAAGELARLASESRSQALQAMAGHAGGAVLVAGGEASAALPELRRAAAAWRALRMPYEAARTGVLIAHACAALGDQAGAQLEVENARATFTALGAAPDLAALAAVDVLNGVDAPSGGQEAAVLSPREAEVLALVAAGHTNKAISEQLTISPHTVGRHLENIFAKLGVTSRAAATAWAYEHGLL